MPPMVKSSEGSWGMRLAEGTTVCPFCSKKSRKIDRSSAASTGSAYRGALEVRGARLGARAPLRGEAGLATVRGWLVEVGRDPLVGQVLLGDPAARIVVGVAVARAESHLTCA